VEKSDGSCFSDDDKRDEVYIGTRYNTFDSNKIIRFKPNGGNFDMYVDKNRLKRNVLSNKPIPTLVVETIINIYQSKELKVKQRQTAFHPNTPPIETYSSHHCQLSIRSQWVTSICYDYQIYACKWMEGLEKDILMNNYSRRRFKQSDPMCKRFDEFDSSLVFHVNEKKVVIGNSPIYDYHNMRTAGGVLADRAGLGKTLTMILLCIEHCSKIPIPSRLDPLKFTYYPNTNTTLIITPSYLTEQWSSEIFKHTSPPLKHFIISNKKDHNTITYKDILTADIIIVSERFLRSKHYQEQCAVQSFTTLQMGHDSPLDHGTPILHFIEWRRIIVDEGDLILPNINHILLYHRSLFKWYVSATPVVTQELIRYLNWNIPEQNVKPYLDAFSICRTKDQVCIDLPRCEVKTIYIPMTFLEKEIYHRKGQTSMQRRKLCSTMLHYKKYTHYFKTIDNLKDNLLCEYKKSSISIKQLQIKNMEQIDCVTELLKQSYVSRMTDDMIRESKNHLCILQKNQVDLERDLLNMSHKACFQESKLSSFSEPGVILECSICYKEIDKTDMTVTSCCHLYCNDCIALIEKCSICRNAFTTTRVSNIISYGSKIDTMLSYITSIPKTEQILLYSQWVKSLHVVEQCLSENNISCVIFSNDISKIGKILQDFKDNKTRVLLLSVQTHNAGLDLYQANNVLFMDALKGDPCDILKKEEQAHGRVHRIGQTDTVKIVKFVIEQSIEDTRASE
jgi:DNA repair protein RAD5